MKVRRDWTSIDSMRTLSIRGNQWIRFAGCFLGFVEGLAVLDVYLVSVAQVDAVASQNLKRLVIRNKNSLAKKLTTVAVLFLEGNH